MEETWTDEYGVLFSVDKEKLIKAPKGLQDYYIPEGTKVIGRNAFSDSSETLEHIHIPKSVERIDDFAFYTYHSWRKLESLDVPDSVQSIGYYAFLAIENVNYSGWARTGFPWGAKRINGKLNTDRGVKANKDEKPCYVENYHMSGSPSWLCYTGEMLNGLPHGKGGYYDCHSGTPHEVGTYYKGKLVDGDRWTPQGVRYSPSGDTWNGYGTGVDSEGNVYTGKWIFGHTEEEFDELWHEIN